MDKKTFRKRFAVVWEITGLVLGGGLIYLPADKGKCVIEGAMEGFNIETGSFFGFKPELLIFAMLFVIIYITSLTVFKNEPFTKKYEKYSSMIMLITVVSAALFRVR